MDKRPKISLIGGGNIGGTLAYLIANKYPANIIILDVNYDITQGKALDISHSSSPLQGSATIMATDNYQDIKDSDVVIVSAGKGRKSNITRDELLVTNAEIIRNVGYNIKKHCPEAFVIVITNPLDAMAWLMQQSSKLPHNKVIGMAGVLDTARFNYFLAKELNVAVEDVNSIILGEHNDNMIPLIRYSTVGGININVMIKNGLISEKTIDHVITRTCHSGAEIVKLLKVASAYYAPAASALLMAESYLFNKRRVLCCSAYFNGEYGINNIYLGAPVIISSKGVEKIIELDLEEKERKQLSNSVTNINNLIDKVSNLVSVK